jgi:hypothetical protein
MEPMPAWKPRTVLPSLSVVELEDQPSPLHDAIRAYLAAVHVKADR